MLLLPRPQGRPGQGRRGSPSRPAGAGGAGRPRHRPERLAGHGGADGGGRQGPVWPACQGRHPPVAAARPRSRGRGRGGPGGRCGTAGSAGGYRFDTGPSVLTMPEVVPLDRRGGRRGAGRLARAGPARPDLPAHLSDDGARLGHRARGPSGWRGRGRAARRARGGRPLPGLPRPPGADVRGRVEPVHRPQRRRPGRPGTAAGPAGGWPASGGFRRLHNLVATHLTRLRAAPAHTFQALYTGLSPFDAPGTLSPWSPAWTPWAGPGSPPGRHARPRPGPGRGWPRRPGPARGSSTRVERVEGGRAGSPGWSWPAASAWPPATWS